MASTARQSNKRLADIATGHAADAADRVPSRTFRSECVAGDIYLELTGEHS